MNTIDGFVQGLGFVCVGIAWVVSWVAMLYLTYETGRKEADISSWACLPFLVITILTAIYGWYFGALSCGAGG